MANSIAVSKANDVLMTSAGHLVKYSGTTGGLAWTKTIPSVGNSVTSDPNTGNIILTGSFQGVQDFGGGPVDTFNNGGIFMAGYDPSGNYLWVTATGGSGDVGLGVSIDSSGNLALTGKASNGIYFGGAQSYYGNGQLNSFVATFSLSGNAAPVFGWAKTVGQASTGASQGNAIALDSLGHVLVGGSFSATVDFGGISVAAGAPGYSSGFVAQFSR